MEPRTRGEGKENLFLSPKTEKIEIFSRRGNQRFMIRLFGDSLWRELPIRCGKREGETVSRGGTELERGAARVFRSREPLGWFVARKDECVHTHARRFFLHACNSSSPPLFSFALAVNFQAARACRFAFPAGSCCHTFLLFPPRHLSNGRGDGRTKYVLNYSYRGRCSVEIIQLGSQRAHPRINDVAKTECPPVARCD